MFARGYFTAEESLSSRSVVGSKAFVQSQALRACCILFLLVGQYLLAGLVRGVQTDFDSVSKDGVVDAGKVNFKRTRLFVVNSDFI